MSHHDLDVWQLSVDFVASIYSLTAAFPSSERFGLTSQLRRASVSVSANIAEGHGRRSTGDYLRFLAIARGSLMECDALLHVAHRLDLLPTESLDPLLSSLTQVGRMLSALIARLEAKSNSPSTRRPPTIPPS